MQKYDEQLSIFAFNFNLRRYNEVCRRTPVGYRRRSRALLGSDEEEEGLMDGARHVIECLLTQETRVHDASDDVAIASIHQSLGQGPRRRQEKALGR
jgi:hypothetical protein